MDALLYTWCFAGCTFVWCCNPASGWMLGVTSAGATVVRLAWCFYGCTVTYLMLCWMHSCLMLSRALAWGWMLDTSAGATVVRWRLIWCKQSKAAFRHRRLHQQQMVHQRAGKSLFTYYVSRILAVLDPPAPFRQRSSSFAWPPLPPYSENTSLTLPSPFVSRFHHLLHPLQKQYVNRP